MHVKTQFDTIINLTEFQTIKKEMYDKQPSGTVFHTISAVSEERSKMESPHPQDAYVTSISSSATLAAFPEDMKTEVELAYNALFTALSEGKTAFNMTVYFPVPDSTE